MLLNLVRRFVGTLLALLPDGILGRILPPSLRFARSQITEPAALRGERRLIIAPLNYAGQAYEWSRAVERADNSIAAQNAMIRTRSDFHHTTDYSVPVGAYAASGRWHREWKRHVLASATHVIVEGQKQPFGKILVQSTEQQVRELQDAGIHVAMLCHGSDIRLPSRHAAAHVDSPFLDPARPQTRRLEWVTRRNAGILDRLGLPTFVSTPDLLIDVPDARWLPVTIRPEYWESTTEVLSRKVPVVVHAPSSGWLKGSDLVDGVMARLESEGLIEYRRLQGVPHSEMPDAYRAADIVLEQFRIGTYSVAACEAMAAGRLVIAYISDQVAQVVTEATGLSLPVHSTTAGDLEATIRALLREREVAQLQAARGPEFVSSVHNGVLSAEVLQPFLDTMN